MRKLIVGSIASLIVLIAWMLYLHYDAKRFMLNLATPLRTTEVQPLDSVSKESTVIPSNRETRSDSDEWVGLPSSSQASDSIESSETESNVVSEEDPLKTPQEPEDTKFSPELETLFSEYNNLHQQSIEVSKEFSPLMTRHITATHRIRKIVLEELGAATDKAAKQALYDELKEIQTWKEEVKPRTMALQDERQRLSEARLNLLKAAGFSSVEEFMNMHQETYITWVSE